MTRNLVLGAALLIAQPAYSAPVADVHWSALAHALFPAVETVPVDRLPGDVTRMLADRKARLAACRRDIPCILQAAQWPDDEVRLLAIGAARLASERQRRAAPDDGIAAEVTNQLSGLNGIFAVYGQAAKPRYPEIDGPAPRAAAVDPGGGPDAIDRNVGYAVDLADASRGDPVIRLDWSIGLALALLDTHDRGDAVALASIEIQDNAAATVRARHLDWTRYRYTAIIVPGIGPDDLGTPLSARGKLNVRMAAQRFADGAAPFIILSGSSVHPRGTHFVEALEMRKALIARFGVPAEAILIDPYARHTTTNLRNVTRRLIALGAPLSRDALIVTNVEQSNMIESPQFAVRNQQELGYLPGTIGKRVSSNELTFRPSISSLRVDPRDPLDP